MTKLQIPLRGMTERKARARAKIEADSPEGNDRKKGRSNSKGKSNSKGEGRVRSLIGND